MPVPKDTLARFTLRFLLRLDAREYVYRGRYHSTLASALCVLCMTRFSGTIYPHWYEDMPVGGFTGLLVCDDCQRMLEGRGTCKQ